MVTEYMGILQRAPLLKADGLSSELYLLADFNGTVLAGMNMDDGYELQFATWDWGNNRTSLEQGHYHYDKYEGAKADFADRSGLIQKGRQFSDEQLTAMYRCLQDALDGHCELTDVQEETIRKVSKQIEFSLNIFTGLYRFTVSHCGSHTPHPTLKPYPAVSALRTRYLYSYYCFLK